MLTECPWDQRCKSEECASLCAHGKLCELMWADIYKTTYCVPLTLSEDGCVNAHGRDHDWCVTIINQRIKSTWVAQLSTSLLCISSSNVFNSNIGMLSEKCHFSLRAQRVELTLQTEAVQLKLIFSVYTEGNMWKKVAPCELMQTYLLLRCSGQSRRIIPAVLRP